MMQLQKCSNNHFFSFEWKKNNTKIWFRAILYKLCFVELRLVQALQVQKLLYMLVCTSKHEILFIISRPINIDAICPCKFCQQFLIYKSVPPRLFHMHMINAAIQNKKEKKYSSTEAEPSLLVYLLY